MNACWGAFLWECCWYIPWFPFFAAKGKEVNNDENSDNKEEEEFEYLSSLVASGQSRLASEFELLKVLGKGGFGDVLKVVLCS